jgi:hypothetical protein
MSQARNTHLRLEADRILAVLLQRSAVVAWQRTTWRYRPDIRRTQHMLLRHQEEPRRLLVVGHTEPEVDRSQPRGSHSGEDTAVAVVAAVVSIGCIGHVEADALLLLRRFDSSLPA